MQSGVLLLTTTVALAALVAGPQGALGITYTRWGKTSCPNTSARVYSGIMAGSKYNQGGGSNYLCLPPNPDFLSIRPGMDVGRATLEGVEYQFGDAPTRYYRRKTQHDGPCVVCKTRRANVLMIPAKIRCPRGWTKEYYGYLMATRKGQAHRYEWICMDRYMQSVPGSVTNTNPATVYFSESTCNGIHCPPYGAGKEITCVVCTI